MKGIIKHSIAVFSIVLLVLSCQKQVDYGPDINLIKGQITSINARLDSITSAIKLVTSQLTSIESSLKTKIDNANNRIDSISNALVTLKTQVNTNTTNIASATKSISEITTSITGLTSDVKTINTSLTNTNTELKSQTKSLLSSIDSSFKIIKIIDSTLKVTGVSTDTLNAKTILLNTSYNDILSKYLELLKLVKTTTLITEIDGSVFKGSFIRGSLLNFYELDTNLNQTGRSFNATIKDDYGNFTLKAQNIMGKLVRVVGDGFYWNEVLNENSSSRITLTALCKIDSNETVNVNVLTELERPRVEYLYNIKGLTFDSAKSQAVTEVLKAFGYTNTAIKRAEKVGVVGIGDESKILLAISTLMQGYRTESEVTQILSDFGQDLEKDGTLTDVNIGNDLATHLYYVDTATVLNNFKVKYRKLYNADTVNSIDMRFIKNFKNNTVFVKDKELVEYNELGYYNTYKNILYPSNSEFKSSGGFGTDGTPFSISARIKNKGIKIKVEFVDLDGNTLTPSSGFNMIFWENNICLGWVTTTIPMRPTLTAEGIGFYEYRTELTVPTWKSKVKIIFYERGNAIPTRNKIVTFN